MPKEISEYIPTKARKKISKHFKKLDSYKNNSKKTYSQYSGFGKHLCDGSTSPYDIVSELLVEMDKAFNTCNNCLEKNALALAKLSASRGGTIASVLLKSLDKKQGGKLAEDLAHVYEHILYAVKQFITENDQEILKGASYASKQILEGWKCNKGRRV